MFSGLIERLQTPNVRDLYGDWNYDDHRSRDNMDDLVIEMVSQYFNGLGGGTMETDTTLLTIMDINNTYIDNTFNISVKVSSRINPYQTLIYSLVRIGGNIFISERTVTINERL